MARSYIKKYGASLRFNEDFLDCLRLRGATIDKPEQSSLVVLSDEDRANIPLLKDIEYCELYAKLYLMKYDMDYILDIKNKSSINYINFWCLFPGHVSMKLQIIVVTSGLLLRNKFSEASYLYSLLSISSRESIQCRHTAPR